MWHVLQGDGMHGEQPRMLLHTQVPLIRTRLKQRPSKQKPTAAATINELPGVQAWIDTGAHQQLLWLISAAHHVECLFWAWKLNTRVSVHIDVKHI